MKDDQQKVMMPSLHRWMIRVCTAALNDTSSSCRMKMRDICFLDGLKYVKAQFQTFLKMDGIIL